jgi:ribosomal protein S24E
MEALTQDFFKLWEDEIAAYQEVALVLDEQKNTLMKWNIKEFQSVTQKAAMTISHAHLITDRRNELMESLFLVKNIDSEKISLKNLDTIFDEEEIKEKTRIFFKVFSNTLRKIDSLSNENKELIRTGLELVGDNLELIADIIDRDRVYSRVGIINQSRTSLLINKRV